MVTNHLPFSSTSSYGSGTTSSPGAESAPTTGLSQAWETKQTLKGVYRGQEELRCQVQPIQHCKSIQQWDHQKRWLCVSLICCFEKRSDKSGKYCDFSMWRQMFLQKKQEYLGVCEPSVLFPPLWPLDRGASLEVAEVCLPSLKPAVLRLLTLHVCMWSRKLLVHRIPKKQVYGVWSKHVRTKTPSISLPLKVLLFGSYFFFATYIMGVIILSHFSQSSSTSKFINFLCFLLL